MPLVIPSRSRLEFLLSANAIAGGLESLNLNARPQMKELVRLLAVLVLLPFMAQAGADPADTNTPATQTVPQRSMLGIGGITTTPERKATPRFIGKTLPIPPKQHSAWTAPTTVLPSNYVSATSALFERGLADPRDCEYREIEVGTGSVGRETPEWSPLTDGFCRTPMPACLRSVGMGWCIQWPASARMLT